MMQNLSATERLRDAVVELNDEVRWNRMDVAVQRVAPGFQEQFRYSHLQWGQQIQIADTEILGVKADKEKGEATSRIAVKWYDQSTMMIAATTLRQEWKKAGRGFMLMGETVEAGHPGLLTLPAEQY